MNNKGEIEVGLVVFWGTIGFVIFLFICICVGQDRLTDKCTAQYEASKVAGKNLMDYQCAKELRANDDMFIMPIVIPMGGMR